MFLFYKKGGKKEAVQSDPEHHSFLLSKGWSCFDLDLLTGSDLNFKNRLKEQINWKYKHETWFKNDLTFIIWHDSEKIEYMIRNKYTWLIILIQPNITPDDRKGWV